MNRVRNLLTRFSGRYRTLVLLFIIFAMIVSLLADDILVHRSQLDGERVRDGWGESGHLGRHSCGTASLAQVGSRQHPTRALQPGRSEDLTALGSCTKE